MELGIRRDDNGRTPIERIVGDTTDVPEYINFGSYDLGGKNEVRDVTAHIIIT